MKCNYCDATDGLEDHHIWPVSLGGPDVDSNKIKVCNIHHAILHNMSSRGNIRALTIAGLKKAKERGVVLGNPNIEAARKLANVANSKVADIFASDKLPMIRGMADRGMSLRAIARTLNEQKTPTARGGEWTSTTVGNMLARSK